MRPGRSAIKAIACAVVCAAANSAAHADPTDPLFADFQRSTCTEQEDGRFAAPVSSLYPAIVSAQPILSRADITTPEGRDQLAQALVNANFCPNPNGCSAETLALWNAKYAFWSLANISPIAPYTLERIDQRPLSYHGGVRALINDVLVKNPDAYQITCRPSAFGVIMVNQTTPPQQPGPPTPVDGATPETAPETVPEDKDEKPENQNQGQNQGPQKPKSPLSLFMPDWFAIAQQSQDLTRPYHRRSFARLSYQSNEVNDRRALNVRMAAALPIAKVWTTTIADDEDNPDNIRQINTQIRTFVEYRKQTDNDNNPRNETNNLSLGLTMARAVESRASACSNPLAPNQERYARWRSESEIKWITDDVFASSQALASLSGVYEPCFPKHWNTDPFGWVTDATPLNVGRFNWSAEYTLSLDASEVFVPGEKFRLLDVEDFQRWGGGVRWRGRWTLPNNTAITAQADYVQRIGFNTDIANIELVKGSVNFRPHAHGRVNFGIDFVRGNNLVSLQEQDSWRIGLGIRN